MSSPFSRGKGPSRPGDWGFPHVTQATRWEGLPHPGDCRIGPGRVAPGHGSRPSRYERKTWANRHATGNSANAIRSIRAPDRDGPPSSPEKPLALRVVVLVLCRNRARTAASSRENVDHLGGALSTIKERATGGLEGPGQFARLAWGTGRSRQTGKRHVEGTGPQWLVLLSRVRLWKGDPQIVEDQGRAGAPEDPGPGDP